jgi:hypothetical protein
MKLRITGGVVRNYSENYNSNLFLGSISFRQTGILNRKFNIYKSDPQTSSKDFDAFVIKPDNSLSNNYLFGGAIAGYGNIVHPNDLIGSDISGFLIVSGNSLLFETCRGREVDKKHRFNFYQGFYPMGFFEPPHGQTISMAEALGDAYSFTEQLENGGCAKINVKEYNELIGIVSKNVTNHVIDPTMVRDQLLPIHGPYEECPPVLTQPFYFEELNYTFIAGTFSGGLGGNCYNNNPVPTSLDIDELNLGARYKLEKIYNGQGLPSTYKITGDVNEDDETISNYTSYSWTTNSGSIGNHSKINNNLCRASTMETKVSAGIGNNGQLVQYFHDSDVTFNYDPWDYWEWVFKENADTLPFYNSFLTASLPEGADPNRAFARASSKGTQLFDARLSDVNYWWDNRQCQDIVDFLPYSFGGAIKACPSDYFEVPYYSAIKKFGFFGTRFFNTCKKLNREISFDKSGIKSGVPVYEVPQPLSLDDSERNFDPPYESNGLYSDAVYNNLLLTAKAEEYFNNHAVGNRGFYLWANFPYFSGSQEYQRLASNKEFAADFITLLNLYSYSLKNIPNLISRTAKPSIVIKPSYQEQGHEHLNIILQRGYGADILHDSKTYNLFENRLNKLFTGVENKVDFNWLLSSWGSFVANSDGSPRYDYYQSGISGREERLRTRYLENFSKGYPIDLFPLNDIYYSFDNAIDYEQHERWGRRFATWGKNSILPDIPRRYFEGAFANTGKNLIDVVSIVNGLSVGSNYFYPGAFNNPACGRTLPNKSYHPVIDGEINPNPQVSPPQKYRTSGWLGVGVSEIGKLDYNFSCFTPIFIQNPQSVYCKLGQSPTFRALAVDYHTIPEDKINKRYPEVKYWTDRLKLTDSKGRYLYPMKYSWHRVRKADINEVLRGNYWHQNIQAADPTGVWSCLEGTDGPECSFIHPTGCSPVWSSLKSVNRDSYLFLEGVKNSDASNYYYYCLASGRFGVRASDPFEIKAENFTLFDVSFKNGGGYAGAQLDIKFEIEDKSGDKKTVAATPVSDAVSVSYDGYETDVGAVIEETIEKKRFIRLGETAIGTKIKGLIGKRGQTRSYAPATTIDNRGQRGEMARPIEYGALVRFKIDLDDEKGALLYGYKHLPTCSNYAMPIGGKGVKINATLGGKEIRHQFVEQPAVFGMRNPPAVLYSKLNHIGELYPPILSRGEQPYLGISQWQFHNNLGLIKRFGKASTLQDENKDFIFIPSVYNLTEKQEAYLHVKTKVLKPTDLAGTNCGYTTPSLGRNQLYFVEAFDRYYILCDDKGKVRVPNFNFVAPGLRFGNAGMQYFWLGQPSDTFVKRHPMYGPYAYQWKVNRHNRDRNGNGVTEGLYSMSYGSKYSLMYDSPAAYGLYLKTKNLSLSSPINGNSARNALIALMKTWREKAFPNENPAVLRGKYFGKRGGPGEGYGYGDIRINCNDYDLTSEDPNDYSNGSNEAKCKYLKIAQSNLFIYDEYYCSQRNLKDGVCFDPCLSMRYSHGFFPGGKLLDMMTANGQDGLAGVSMKAITRITNNASDTDRNVSPSSSTSPQQRLRGPGMSPYEEERKNASGTPQDLTISPCKAGGAEHCNFITPTIHIGEESFLIGQNNGYQATLLNIRNLIPNS